MPRGVPKVEPSTAYSNELVATKRDELVEKFTGGKDTFTDADTDAAFRSERPFIIAELMALSRHSPDVATRKWALQELLAQGIGKAATKKRNDSEEVGVVMIERGSYGIPLKT